MKQTIKEFRTDINPNGIELIIRAQRVPELCASPCDVHVQVMQSLACTL